MIPLSTKFNKHNFNYSLIKRVNDVAIYKKEKNGIESYETFIVQKYPEYELAGVKIAARESIPSDSTWGMYGFTATTSEQAEQHFEKLSEKVAIKEVNIIANNVIDNNVSNNQNLAKKRGRKSLDVIIEFPKEKFTIESLAKHYGVSKSFIYQRVKDNPLVELVESKGNGGRGKPTCYYRGKD